MRTPHVAHVLFFATLASCARPGPKNVIEARNSNRAVFITAGELQYLIDKNTRSCFLVDMGPVDCAELAATIPEAARHVTWQSSPQPTRAATNEAPAAPDDRDTAAPSAGDDQRAQLARLMDRHIRSAGAIEVDRVFLDQVLEKPMLARGARIVPSIRDGKPNGFKLYAIRPSSLFARLGLRNGDTVHTVNGRSLAGPEDALATYQALRDASRFEIQLTRRGKPVTLTILVAEPSAN